MLEKGLMLLELLYLLPKKEVESSTYMPQGKHTKRLRNKAGAR